MIKWRGGGGKRNGIGAGSTIINWGGMNGIGAG